MKKLITIMAALAVSLSFALGADADKKADKKGMTPEERFKKLDTDGDGFVSHDEFMASPQAQKDPAKAEAMFKKKDKNGDGKLTLEEFMAGGHKKAEATAAATPAATPAAAPAEAPKDAPAAPAAK